MKKNKLLSFWGSHALTVSKYKPAKVLRGKTFKLLFYQIFLKFPHNITIFALRYNKKANIR